MKDDNRVSEQTFRIGVVASDPTCVRPATLETLDTVDSWDYRVGAVGQTFLLHDIFPGQQFLPISFFLNGDDIPEDREGFQLEIIVETEGEFPQFLLPLQTSTTAFQSTTITITGN